MIDNVIIRETPSAPPLLTLIYPENGATGLPVTGFNLTWGLLPESGPVDGYSVYLASSDENIFDEYEYRWDTTNTYFNPATEGGVEFEYNQRWYWTVSAYNDSGEDTVEPPYWFVIEESIHTFPWTENFDAALTLPARWTMYDLDGGGTYWQGSTAYSHSSPNSFMHGYSSTPATGQDGWLITPPVQLPTTTGIYIFSWWNYNQWPDDMVYNGLKVNTTNDPNDPDWVELWAPESGSSTWTNVLVNITLYAGQTVFFAFNYAGYFADSWYIDDVSIYELMADNIPPTITHLPLLNTPRHDINYLVYAEIAEDTIWNNPMFTNLYYKTDTETDWIETPMNPGIPPEFTAYIPAQPLGTTIQYYIKAWDSEQNIAMTDNLSFEVNNPTWLYYDTGGTVYIRISGENFFGPTMLFENPFFGTGFPLKLLGTDGATYNATTANLHIYGFDGATITDLITPIPVSFTTAQEYQSFDLSSYDINITTPYFFVAYEDIPGTTYFLWDDTYDYGTTFVIIDGDFYTISRSGSWCIGAYITNGIPTTLQVPVITIADESGQPVLSWDPVYGANGYKVLASADPYAPDPWEQIAFITGTTYTYTGTDDKKFFKVTAVSEAPGKAGYYLSGRALNTKDIKTVPASIKRDRDNKSKMEKARKR